MKNLINNSVLIAETQNCAIKEASPVLIKKAEIRKTTDIEGLFIVLNIQNISSRKPEKLIPPDELETMRTISAVTLDIHLFDIANQDIEIIRDYKYENLSVKRGEIFGNNTIIKIENENAISLAVAVKSVSFLDGFEYTGSSQLWYDTLPSITPLEKMLPKELSEEYKRIYRTGLRRKGDSSAVYFPFIHSDLWLCTCGEISHISEEECWKCRAKKDDIINLAHNEVEIRKSLDVHLKEEAEKAEKERLKQKKIEEERKRAERKKRIIQLAVSLFLLILMLGGYTVFNHIRNVIIPQNNYDKAIELMENADYNEAIEVFSKYSSFKDSSAQIIECKYLNAEDLLANGDYEAALTIYSELGDYKDSADKPFEVEYILFKENYQNGKYSSVIEAYENSEDLHDYEDADAVYHDAVYNLCLSNAENGDYDNAFSDLLSEDEILTIETTICKTGLRYFAKENDEEAEKCFSYISDEDLLTSIEDAYYSRAEQYVENGLYTEALETISSLTNEEKNTEIEASIVDAKYEDAKALVENGDYSAAEELISTLDDEERNSEIEALILDAHYADAEALILDEKYDEAEELLSTLSDSDRNEQLTAQIHLAKAEALLLEAKYDEAKTEFELAGTDLGSDGIKECEYQLGKTAYDNADYETVIAYLSDKTDYEDAKSYFVKASYTYGTALYKDGKTLDSYNTLYAIKEYGPAYIFLVTKTNYYIEIYDKGLGENPNDDPSLESKLYYDDVL